MNKKQRQLAESRVASWTEFFKTRPASGPLGIEDIRLLVQYITYLERNKAESSVHPLYSTVTVSAWLAGLFVGGLIGAAICLFAVAH